MTVVGLLWGRLLDPTLGPINVVLSALGVDKPPIWLGDPKTSLNTIIAVSVWQYSGFPMIIFLAEMENIPYEIHDAATIDGVSTLQRIWFIIIPLVKHVFAMIVLLQIVFSFKVFDIVWAMTSGGPGDSSTVLGVYLYRVAFQYTWFGYGSAVAVFMLIIIFSLSLLYRYFVKVEETRY
jgi:raffinose/stachyose/melibiose transport system permease protein